MVIQIVLSILTSCILIFLNQEILLQFTKRYKAILSFVFCNSYMYAIWIRMFGSQASSNLGGQMYFYGAIIAGIFGFAIFSQM